MVDLNNDVIKEYLNFTGLSVMSLITIAMTEQPDIIKNFEKINKMDATILQTKVKQFMNNDPLFDDQYNVVITVFLSNLMYKNNIIPELVYDTLVKIGSSNVMLEELKQNSQSLINSLTSSIQIGGSWFTVFTKLISVGTVLFTAVLDYSFIQHNIPVFEETYKDALSIYERVAEAKESYEQCGYIPIPATIEMLDRMLLMVDKNAGENDYTKIYRMIICVSNGHLNKYLKENPDFLKTDVEEFSDKASKALIPYGNLVIDNTYSKDLIVLERYLDIADDMLGSMIIYDKDTDNPVINIDKTSTNLKHYATMPPEELARMLKTQADENQKAKIVTSSPSSVKNLISSFFTATSADMFDLGLFLIDKVFEAGPVPAVNIIDSYIFMIQDFCKKKFRELEDFQRESERNLSDFLTKVYRTIQNIRELIKMLRILIWLNGIASVIILNYCRNIFIKFKALRRGQSELEISNDNNFEEIEGESEQLLLEAPRARGPRSRGPRRAPGMNTEDILSSTNTGVRTRTGATVDALIGLKNTPVEDINAIDGGKKRTTRKNKKRKTRRFKRGKKKYTRHRRERLTKRR